MTEMTELADADSLPQSVIAQYAMLASADEMPTRCAVVESRGIDEDLPFDASSHC